MTERCWNFLEVSEALLYLANVVKALALLELVFHLPRALLGLLEAAHRAGLLPVAEVDVAQVEVGAVEVLQQLPPPFERRQTRNESRHHGPVVRGEDVRGATLLCDEDTSAEEVAAALGLAEVIADQAQIEIETRLHLADLPRRHGPCRGGGNGEKTRDFKKPTSHWHVAARWDFKHGEARPSRQSSTMARLFLNASSACSRLLLDWSDS